MGKEFLTKSDMRVAAGELVPRRPAIEPEVLGPDTSTGGPYIQQIAQSLMQAATEASWFSDKVRQAAHQKFADSDKAFWAIRNLQKAMEPVEKALEAAYAAYEQWEEVEYQEQESLRKVRR